MKNNPNPKLVASRMIFIFGIMLSLLIILDPYAPVVLRIIGVTAIVTFCVALGILHYVFKKRE